MKITSKRKFKKVLRMMIDKDITGKQDCFSHSLGFEKIKTYKGRNVVNAPTFLIPKGKIYLHLFTNFYENEKRTTA